jgi:hypothetical protein
VIAQSTVAPWSSISCRTISDSRRLWYIAIRPFQLSQDVVGGRECAEQPVPERTTTRLFMAWIVLHQRSWCHKYSKIVPAVVITGDASSWAGRLRMRNLSTPGYFSPSEVLVKPVFS